MKVLVTGATGFVGCHLTHGLLKDGYAVRALVRSSSQVAKLQEMGAELAIGDITDPEAVEQSVQGCQQVYHLAGKVSYNHRKGAKKAFYAINVQGTQNIAQAAVRAGVERLVYVSSVCAYGIIHSLPADEAHPHRPNTAYRKSKSLGEQVVLSYLQKAGLPVVIVRLTSVCGGGGLNWLSLCQAIADGTFRPIGQGNNYTHLVHVADAVDGLQRCAETPGIVGNCYILAGEKPTQLKELVALIAQEIGVDTPRGHTPKLPFQIYFSLSQGLRTFLDVELPRSHDYEFFLTNRILNIDKSKVDLGYVPTRSIHAGIREAIQWYRQTGQL